ncbi:MAG: hypothetical protein RL345_84, partial [Chloroflexota bacterium]
MLITKRSSARTHQKIGGAANLGSACYGVGEAVGVRVAVRVGLAVRVPVADGVAVRVTVIVAVSTGRV